MRTLSALILWAGVLVLLGVTQPSRAQDASPVLLTGTVVNPYPDGPYAVGVRFDQATQVAPLQCKAVTCPGVLGDARVGDVITLDVNHGDKPTSFSKIDRIARPVGAWIRCAAFGGSLIFLYLITEFAARWRSCKFLIGADNRYSNSQCQIVLWFGAVATMYLGMLVLRVAVLGWDYLGGIGITANVAALTGLSALTFGGAKAITMSKIESAAKAGLAPVKVPAARPSLRTDLFLNDSGQADFGDFQMILITMAAVMIFVGQAFHEAGMLVMSSQIKLPDVDSSLLAGFGIGQGAYLVKKAALKAGDG